jgi:hypothetical protein
MRAISILALLALALSASAMMGDAPPLPCTETVKPKPPRLEEAYEQIRIGMLEKDLRALMAPFEAGGEHRQWPCWGSRDHLLAVTLEGNVFAPEGTLSVKGKTLYRKELGQSRVIATTTNNDGALIFKPGKKK